MIKPYKIAIIDQKGNAGGGIRFAKRLISNFSKYLSDIKIDYYGSPKFIRNSNMNYFNNKNIGINKLKSLTLREEGVLSVQNSNKIIKQLQDKFKVKLKYLPYFYTGDLKKELEIKLKNYDLALFIWPYLIDVPNVKVKKIIVLHDLNFKYNFGGLSSYNILETKKLNTQISQWIKSSEIVVTSNFMKKEVKKFYPKIDKNKIHLIRVGPLTNYKKNHKKNDILKKNNISSNFLLCPTNTKSHKNISNLIQAFSRIQKNFKDIKLVFCGAGTETINGKISKNKVELSDKQKNVIGLGYVSDIDLDFLISKARIVVNTSLYEAGNGSGLDAWYIGTPVAMSNIPPFREHLSFLKVKAEIFDPNKPKDIAIKISKILNFSQSKRLKMIKSSKKNIQKVQWGNIVNDYYNLIFKLL